MTKVAKASGKLKYHTVIIELGSTLPRRDSKKPHLYIGTSLSNAEDRLGQLQRGAGPKFAKGHYVSVFAKSPYSKPAKDPKIAKRRLEETIEKYARYITKLRTLEKRFVNELANLGHGVQYSFVGRKVD